MSAGPLSGQCVPPPDAGRDASSSEAPSPDAAPLDSAAADAPPPEAAPADAPPVDAVRRVDSTTGDMATLPSLGGFCSATGWCWDNPLPQGNNLHAVTEISPIDVWAGGESGTLMHWDGKVWTSFPLPASYQVTGLAGRGSGDVWAAGNVAGTGGTFTAHWDGAKWTPGCSAGALLAGAWESTDSSLWVAAQGGHVLHEAAGACTWIPTATGSDLYTLWGSSGTDIWAAGAAGALEHYDGAWSAVSSGTTNDLTDLSGSAATDVWALGLRAGPLHFGGASDAGTLWTFEPLPSGFPGAVLDLGATTWAFVGGGIYLWNGFLWGSPASGGVMGPLAAAGMAGDGWAVGWYGERTHYDGAGWTPDPYMHGGLSGVWGAGTGLLYAVDGSGLGVVQRTAGGWMPVCGTPQSLNGIWGGVFGGVEQFWAVGNNGSAYVDGGGAWLAATTGVTATLRAVRGTGPSDVWAVGDAGTILHYGGSGWASVTASAGGGTASLQSVWASSTTDAWIVGGNAAGGAVVLRWDGSSWNAVSSPFRSPLSSVFGFDAGHVFAAGMAGEIGEWDGSTWRSLSPPFASRYTAICGRDASDVWFTDDQGGVAHYDGSAFTLESTGTDNPLEGCWTDPAGTTWLVGAGSTVLRR